MQFFHLAQLVLGLAIIAFGMGVNMARHRPGLKDWIEMYIIGGEDPELFDPRAPYARAVNLAGWPTFVAGLSIAVPLPVIWDMVLLLGALLVVAWVAARVYREYKKIRPGSAVEDMA